MRMVEADGYCDFSLTYHASIVLLLLGFPGFHLSIRRDGLVIFWFIDNMLLNIHSVRNNMRAIPISCHTVFRSWGGLLLRSAAIINWPFV